jgi:hypothetical protein
MSSRDPAKDADDCAQYLCSVRSARWDRFEVALDEYIARHNHKLADSTLRELLANAYLRLAPEDSEGHLRVMGTS